MVTLNAENRSRGFKPKQLRRKGIIPGILYGKNLTESISIQFSQAETARFLRANAVGSKAELLVDNKKYTVLLREITYQPMSTEPEHLSFQTLLADEIVLSTARIVLENKDSVSTGVVQQPLFEISYRALPAYLTEKIEINVEEMKVGDSIRVGDLDIANNPNIEVLTPLDTMVLAIVDSRKPLDLPEDEETESAAEAAGESESESEGTDE